MGEKQCMEKNEMTEKLVLTVTPAHADLIVAHILIGPKFLLKIILGAFLAIIVL